VICARSDNDSDKVFHLLEIATTGYGDLALQTKEYVFMDPTLFTFS